jgi:hypothetical protein
LVARHGRAAEIRPFSLAVSNHSPKERTQPIRVVARN